MFTDRKGKQMFVSSLGFTVLFTICMFIAQPAVYSQQLQSINAAFSRTVEEGGATSHSEGRIYYQSEGKLYVRVQSPVNQWLIHSTKNLLIYYPEKNKGYRYNNVRSNNVPFFDAFISHYKEDFGLSQLGFSMVGDTVRNDTLFTRWEHQGKGKKKAGDFILGYHEKKIVYAEAKTRSGETLRKTRFGNHFQYEARFYPKDIELRTYRDNGSLESKSEIQYRDVRFNQELPETVKDFSVPEDAKIEEVNL